jgi:peptidoglycan/LPS O-acetylase OafA/YrhL
MSIASVLQNTGRTLWSNVGQRTGIKGFVALDGLRGYMAWWVVLTHALQLCGLQDKAPAILGRGDRAVSVFISLSGFVICHLLIERNAPYGAYLKRRAFRIFPIYLFALVCAILVAPMYEFAYLAEWVLPRELRTARIAATHANFGKHLLLHLSLLHGMVPDTWLPFSASAFLAPAWSLSLEWQFYLVAPFVVAGLARPGFTRIATVLLLLMAWVIFKKALPLHWEFPSVLPVSIHFFMLGILSRVFLTALSKLAQWVLPVGFLLALIAPNSVGVELALWCIFLAAACFQLRTLQGEDGSNPGGLRKFLRFVTSNSIARRLGEYSYSTYLIHISLFSLAGWLAGKLGGAWTQGAAIGSTAIAMVVLVPLSAMLYRFIEQPFIRLGNRSALRMAPAPS